MMEREREREQVQRHDTQNRHDDAIHPTQLTLHDSLRAAIKCITETCSLTNFRRYVHIPTIRQILRFVYKWPYIWYLHTSRFFFGNFQDPQLASSSERQYLGRRFEIDPEESATALGLLAWRKSAMLVIMVMAAFVVGFDINRINMTLQKWQYSEEAARAPSFHGLSGFPPRDLDTDYMSMRAQNYLNITKPNEWSTVSGMWRLETDDGHVSDLCLTPGGQSAAKSIAGERAKLTRCSRDSQWLHGSDKTNFWDDEQMILSTKPGWWTIDSLTQSQDCDMSLVIEAGSDKKGCANQTNFAWRSYDGYCLEGENCNE